MNIKDVYWNYGYSEAKHIFFFFPHSTKDVCLDHINLLDMWVPLYNFGGSGFLKSILGIQIFSWSLWGGTLDNSRELRNSVRLWPSSVMSRIVSCIAKNSSRICCNNFGFISLTLLFFTVRIPSSLRATGCFCNLGPFVTSIKQLKKKIEINSEHFRTFVWKYF